MLIMKNWNLYVETSNDLVARNIIIDESSMLCNLPSADSCDINKQKSYVQVEFEIGLGSILDLHLSLAQK